MATKLTTLTRADVKTVHAALREALQGVADQFGLTYAPGRVNYSDAEMRGSFTLAAVAASGIPADFIKHCPAYGLKPEDFGAEFTSNGRTFTITGIKPRRHKYPISGKGAQGGSYKFTASQVTNGLKRPATATTPSDGLTVGQQVTFLGLFGGGVVGTIQSFLGQGRAEVLTTTGETRTPKRTDLIPVKGTRAEAEILDDIGCVYGNLSPENLTCDGECSNSEVARKSRDYNKALKALFKELGREVSESESYDFYQQERAS